MTQSVHKKLYIKTWGCQMNEYDSRRMADVLAPLGYRAGDGPEGADLIILNTCHIREKATDKVFSELGRLREHKDARAKQGGRALLAVAGCVAQAEGDVITARAPYVDLVFGPQTYHLLPEMIARASGVLPGPRPIHTEFPVESKFDHLPGEQGHQGVTAFLSIQEGCDKFCTYCVVPYTRGAEFSRPASALLEEARQIVNAGAKEITLLGQNVNAWHGEGPDGKTWGLGHLIEALAKLDNLAQIRYTTSHPGNMADDLIAAHRDIDKLMPFLHLPVQSGSDTILKAMNRKHTADDYRRLIDKIRSTCPDIAFSSDFIVGFPGESDADHAESLRLIRDVGYASAYSFKFSARPGTPAAAMPGLIREDIKSARLEELQALVWTQQQAFNAACIGRILPVLLDRPGREAGQLHGRTPYNQSIHVAAEAGALGTIVPVRITGGHQNSVSGEIHSRSLF